jgi:DNA-binding Lrp family transcriptional regulator
MPSAYILLTTEIGAEPYVLETIRKINGVEKAYNLWRVYDIIGKIKAENMEKLKNIITIKIEKIGKINSKLTMIIDENIPKTIEHEVFFEEVPIIQ